MAAPAGLVVAWEGLNSAIPAGWARLTDFDDAFPRGADDGSISGVFGGSADHAHDINHVHPIPSHTHSGSWASAATGMTVGITTGALAVPQANHTHTVTLENESGTTLSAVASVLTQIPAYLDVILIESDGSADIPDNALVWFNGTSPPEDWEVATAVDGRYWRGATASGDGGSTGGTLATHAHSNHVHLIGAHTHDADVPSHASGATRIASGLDVQASSTNTTHGDGTSAATAASTGSAAQTASASEPPYLTLLPVRSTMAIEVVKTGLVFSWYGEAEDIPAGYEIADGQDGRCDLLGRFPKGDITGAQSIGGSESHTHPVPSHTHTAAHTHGTGTLGTLSGAPGDQQGSQAGATAVAAAGHTHTFTPATSGSTNPGADATTAVTSNGSNLPPYRTIIWIEKIDEFTASPFRRRYVPHRILPYRERVR